MSTPLNISASGLCADCGTTHSLGAGNSRKYALELMQQLETTCGLDDGKRPECSTDALWGEARGQMFGVLECETPAGATVVLKAFSGQYNGQWLIEGWVPPILDVQAFHRLSDPVDKQIKHLDVVIGEGGDTKEQIQERKALSQQLMKDVHALYHLRNFRGETRPLSKVFPGGIPTGVGDCCAPKLLQYAALKGLKPLGLSEFFWGRENRSGKRQHRQFYPACAEKCQPILGFMLCGAPEKYVPSAPMPDELEILYADDDLVVVVKPSGLLAVPGRGADKQDCVVSRIKRRYPNGIEQPSVHRLDMDTSGLMVLAFTKEAHRELSRQFHDREPEKRYVALLEGELQQDAGTIELPFRLDVEDRPRQIYDPIHGKMGITHWKTLWVKQGQTCVEFHPETGRTHQLRVHAASEHGLGCPIVGDRLYGSGTAPGQLKLHASLLSVTHPRTSERMEFFSDVDFMTGGLG